MVWAGESSAPPTGLGLERGPGARGGRLELNETSAWLWCGRCTVVMGVVGVPAAPALTGWTTACPSERAHEDGNARAALFADAKLAENPVEQIVGHRLAGDLAQRFQAGAQVDGDEVRG